MTGLAAHESAADERARHAAAAASGVRTRAVRLRAVAARSLSGERSLLLSFVAGVVTGHCAKRIRRRRASTAARALRRGAGREPGGDGKDTVVIYRERSSGWTSLGLRLLVPALIRGGLGGSGAQTGDS
ncbi:MAG: hypothetical protein AAFX58_01355 [Pseudomonadota bacterium]